MSVVYSDKVTNLDYFLVSHLLGTENWTFFNPVCCWQIQKYELIETDFKNRCRNLPLSRHFQLCSNQGYRN